MMDLIDRQEGIKAINSLTYPSSLTDVKRVLIELPTVDAKPVRHGHWIIGKDWCTCSECNQGMYYERGRSGKSNIINAMSIAVHYCPNCGAKMDENKVEKDDKG